MLPLTHGAWPESGHDKQVVAARGPWGGGRGNSTGGTIHEHALCCMQLSFLCSSSVGRSNRSDIHKTSKLMAACATTATTAAALSSATLVGHDKQQKLLQGSSRVTTRPAGWVQQVFKHLTGRVGWLSNSHRSGQVTLTRPNPTREVSTQPVSSPGQIDIDTVNIVYYFGCLSI